MGGASGVAVGGGQLPPVPYALPTAVPPVVVRKNICALSTLPVQCRSVKFMQNSTKCVKTLHSQC